MRSVRTGVVFVAVAMLVACGGEAGTSTPEDTGLSVVLPAPFTARLVDSVGISAEVQGFEVRDAEWTWTIESSPATSSASVEVVGPASAIVTSGVEGDVVVRVQARAGGVESVASTTISFDADHTLPAGTEFNPAPYVEPRLETLQMEDPDTGVLREVTVAVLGDYAVDGDLVIGRVSVDGSIATQGTYTPASTFPSATIPYFFKSSWEDMLVERFTEGEKAAIREALATISARTVLEFEEVSASSLRTAIVFSRREGGVMAAGCWAESNAFIYPNRRMVNLGFREGDCMTSRILKHEILHAVGLHHEHQRNDRDDNVSISVTSALGVADPFYVLNFQQPPANRDVGPYDWFSVMHYQLGSQSGAFGEFATMEVADWNSVPFSRFEEEVGKFRRLSNWDVATINTIYSDSYSIDADRIVAGERIGEVAFIGQEGAVIRQMSPEYDRPLDYGYVHEFAYPNGLLSREVVVCASSDQVVAMAIRNTPENRSFTTPEGVGVEASETELLSLMGAPDQTTEFGDFRVHEYEAPSGRGYVAFTYELPYTGEAFAVSVTDPEGCVVTVSP